MQPCKTGDQLYSDPSSNGECSLDQGSITSTRLYLEEKRNTQSVWPDKKCQMSIKVAQIWFH